MYKSALSEGNSCCDYNFLTDQQKVKVYLFVSIFNFFFYILKTLGINMRLVALKRLQIHRQTAVQEHCALYMLNR